MSVVTKRGGSSIDRDLRKIPYIDRIQAIDLVSDGDYFIARDLESGYWVYVNAVDREVRVFDRFIDALAYGLHVRPEDIRSIDVVKAGEDGVTLRICTTEGCDNYKAYLK
jgi:hypothetical protein